MRRFKKNKNFFPLLLITLVVFFILKASFSQSGMYPTHDGEIHIIRSINFKSELLKGQFPVRMIPQQAYSYGYAVFNFFYPLPAYITSVFQLLGFSTVLSFKLMQLLVTFLSIYVFFLWMNKHFDKKSSLTAAIVYGLAPFRILTLYVTGQIGGYFALLFVPLIGIGLFNLLKTKESNGVVLAIGIAGLITSHLLSAIIFFIPLFGYTLYLFKDTFTKKKIQQFIFWSLIGFGLSGFYFIPFMIEKSWIKLGHSILVDHREHWPTLKQLFYSPWGYGHSNNGPNDGMTFQVGFSIVVGFFTALSIFFLKKKKSLFGLLLILTFLILFYLATPYSKPIWEVLIPMQLIQFPWRLLAATSLVGSMLIAWTSSQLSGIYKNIFMIFILFLSFYNVRNYVRPWPLDWRIDSDFSSNLHALHGPTDISWELMPITASQIPLGTPVFIADATDEAIVSFSISEPSQGPVKKIIDIDLNKESQIGLELWDLPTWELFVDDTKVSKSMTPQGTIAIAVPAGQHKIKVKLIETKVERVSNAISIFSAIVILVYVVNKRKKVL